LGVNRPSLSPFENVAGEITNFDARFVLLHIRIGTELSVLIFKKERNIRDRHNDSVPIEWISEGNSSNCSCRVCLLALIIQLK
jgi:hypothetical protein